MPNVGLGGQVFAEHSALAEGSDSWQLLSAAVEETAPTEVPLQPVTATLHEVQNGFFLLAE